MQILASALPGFRDLRAPLTAGYLWLILLWLVIKPDLSTRPTNEIMGTTYDLAKAAGPIWVGIGVGVCAYLIGSISQSLSSALNTYLTNIWNRTYSYYDLREKRGKALPKIFASYHSDPVTKYEARALELVGDKEILNDEGDLVDMEVQVQTRGFLAREDVLQKIELPATLLLTEQPQLFAEADRIRGESQFRLAVIVPLTAVISFATVTDSAWWILLLVPVVILLLQGFSKNLDYRSLMFGAVQVGHIKSERFEEFKDWAERLSKYPDR